MEQDPSTLPFTSLHTPSEVRLPSIAAAIPDEQSRPHGTRPGRRCNHAAVLMCSVQFAAVCVDCIFHHRRSAIFRLEDALHTGPAFILQLFNRPRHSWDLTLSCTCVLLRSNVTFPFVRLEQTGCSTLRSIVHCVTFF